MRDSVHARTAVLLSCVLLLFCLSAAAGAQPAFLVKDLNTTRPGDNAPGSGLTVVGETIFFPVSDGIHGAELWRTDGTEAGSHLVADICPGSCSSGPGNLTAVGGLLFFTADDGLHGRELWKSDGTRAGTAMVKDLVPPGDFSWVDNFTELGGLLLFTVSSYNTRHELWRSDGTAAGTFRLRDFGPGDHALVMPYPPVCLGGKLFFSAEDGTHGEELWTTDGTAAGTAQLKDINPGPAGSAPGNLQMVAAGSKVLFQADDGVHGYELWGSDGTEAGTVLVKDIHPGVGTAILNGLTAAGGEAFFLGSADGVGQQLWKSDGTEAGTLPVKPVPSSVSWLRVAGSRLFFFADCDLWTSDGTAAGTVLVETIPGPYCGIWTTPVTGDSPLFLFTTADATHTTGLWQSDGTPAGTSLVSDLSSSGNAPAGAGDLWYFSAVTQLNAVPDLWTTDGTAAGTRKLRINHQASGLGQLQGPRALFDFDGTLLFQGDDGQTGAELWRSDGTAAGTTLVKDLSPGPFSSLPAEITRAGSTIFFRSNAGNTYEKLWKTDGTPAGTLLLHTDDQFYNFGNFSPRDLTAFGSGLLFLGSQSNNPPELMRSDGTPAGTVLIGPGLGFFGSSLVSLGNQVLFQSYGLEDLWRSDGTSPGTVLLGSKILPIHHFLKDASAVRDGVLYFAGTDPASGEELWRSDGTVAGTYLLAETVPGPDSKPLGPFATTGPAVYFAAGGHELWKSGAGGTALVRALPGDDSAGIRSLTPLGGKLYFSYDDGAHGRELWVSDGTAAGTHLLADLLPGSGSSGPKELHVEGNLLVFAASDGVHGLEPWRSDGTPLGTRMIQDIAPGELPSSPTEFTASGANLYFGANDGTTGFELWAVPRASLLATFADVPVDYWARQFVEALAASGITGGCAPGSFCPERQVTRAEAAVFLVSASRGAGFVPPPGGGTLFQDIPAGYWAGPWIEQLARDGVTAGCGGGRFCPDLPLTRAEMAVLLLGARYGSGFVPPPVTGTVFTDVPPDYWAARWIERLAAEGVTAGCGGGSYCPERTITRAEMAVFLVRMFGLPLP
ncbi:MAG: ELWxxDGT repeat protein [Thermoanaerobaculia bacterium]